MELYGQEPEFELLASFLPFLSSTRVLDVGAERGAFAEVMLAAGSERVDLIEPAPDNLAYLRERFAGEGRAVVHASAVGEHDGEAMLHLAVGPNGQPLAFGHTLLERPGTQQVEWPGQVDVEIRSLATLVSSGDIPAKVGLLKIDTEGSDLAVVRGMGQLECDVVMVEHWSDLPNSLGPCPWSTDELVSTMAARGFAQFAFLLHRDEVVTFRWDDAGVGAGEVGNVVFLQERMVAMLAPLLLSAASRLALVSVEHLREVRRAADERRDLIEAVARERDLQVNAARERLETITRLNAEHRSEIAALERERDDQAAAAAERLAMLDRIAAERELQATAAIERLATIEELQADRDSHAAAAAARLIEIERLTLELEIQSLAAEQRLASLEVLGRERRAGDPPHSGWS
jgi:FkbM family methyltransferase